MLLHLQQAIVTYFPRFSALYIVLRAAANTAGTAKSSKQSMDGEHPGAANWHFELTGRHLYDSNINYRAMNAD